MSQSYRIRTEVGKDKYVNVLLEQDFEQLEILSLKILQSQIYTRLCSDYGVVAGRITANSGFGLPNCKVSIFIPLSNEDENNPIISDLYPYKLLSDTNEDGYRYNLLPYVKSHSGHNPTGSFPDRIDVLTDPNLIEVYDKYYKFTVKTNDSGDFLIFGVPLGTQTIHVDIDLSDIGEFSLSPQDLIRLGVATESQVAGTEFRTSTDLNTLPQIITLNRTINVEPLWGQPEVCTIGITRTDFDITEESGIEITPTAIFMGSIFSNGNDQFQTQRCRPKLRSGDLCNLVAGPGEILAIRQTIFNDDTGRPVLETFPLESGGQVIDDNGAWLVDVPMNLDYVTTNEFGERVISNDPKVGIPTRGKYRFKIKWNQSPTLSEDIKRGYFLVPNVREYGWEVNVDKDPLVIQDWITNPLSIPPTIDPNFYPNNELAKKSYSFSLDWNDYVDPQTAINCEDTFYLMSFNKVYTVSQLIDQYRRGFLPNEFVGIKNNLDDACESDNVKFPNNDANYRFDLLYLLALVAMFIFKPILFGLVPIIHIVAALVAILGFVFGIIVGVILYIVLPICYVIAGIVAFLNWLGAGLEPIDCIDPEEINQIMDDMFNLYKKILNINLPLLVYPNCELCSCEPGGELSTPPSSVQSSGNYVAAATETGGNGILSTYMLPTQYDVKDVDVQFRSGIQALLAGAAYTRDEPSGKARVPQFSSFGTDTTCPSVSTPEDPTKIVLFTNNLTLAERINLFNVKAKYFDENQITNPGGGVNRIKVTFNTPNNNPLTKFHLDNMLVISCKENTLSNFPVGQIITFQDPNLSSDININGFTQLNQYGTGAVTGSTYRQQPIENVQLSYANPNGNGSISVLGGYDLFFSGDPQFHKFPMDIEYFQVITAMTYSNYTGQCQSASLSNNKTLPHRTLGNDTLLREVNGVYSYSYYPPSPPHQQFPPARLYNPMKLYKKNTEQVIVFLVRGVDPYSTRQPCEYDLSRLFGYDLDVNGLPQGNVIVRGNYKLNIPIQASNNNNNLNGLRAVRHSFGITSTTQNILSTSDIITGIPLYYNSFNFELSTSGLAKFSSFTSDMPSYYSSLDSSVPASFRPNDVPSTSQISLSRFAETPSVFYNNSEVLRVKSHAATINQFANPTLPFQGGNSPYYWGFSVEIDSFLGTFPAGSNTSGCNRDYFGALPNDYLYDTRGYYVNEIIDGGSLMGQEKSRITSAVFDFYADGWYFAPRYNNTYNFQAATTPTNARKIIMRSDRLPTSSTVTDVQGNSLPLQSNLIFSLFRLSDSGLTQGTTGTASFIGGGADPSNLDLVTSESVPNPVFESFTCENAVPLFCYTVGTNNEISIKPDDNICYTNGVTGKKIMKNGCYQLISEILLSLPADLLIVNEWTSRLLVNFGACRNVWSHLFVNNWINGSLYAFAFKNDRIFDANNVPRSQYCRRTLYLHPTNNFYYRSSPYVTGTTTGFIGAPPSTFNILPFVPGIPFGGNDRNLKFPTTMLDLGPRSQFLQELVFSDEFDGYVVNRMDDSSYSDVSEILNLLIISRLTNLSFIGILLSAAGGTIFEFFLNNRDLFKNLVDADYAQMISISSELGISAFEPANYPTDPNGQDPIYINSPFASDVVMGIFWSSNTQVRDYISPKRNIINTNANLGSICGFSNIPVFSQEVPFYQWQIQPNADGGAAESIFGSQGNNWFTNPINSNGTFFSSNYQSMDRLQQTSRYFRYDSNTKGTGYIFATDQNGDEDGNRQLWSHNNPDDNNITIGAPFHFYFGLKKGKTSFDRFRRKWIKFDTITD